MRHVWTTAALLLALCAPVLADAQGKGQGRGRDPGRGEDKVEKRWEPRGPAKSAAKQARTWRRGQVLPPAYRGAVIEDPHRYGLYAPPRGHAWVRVGGDVYLTSLGSGQIVEVLRDTL